MYIHVNAEAEIRSIPEAKVKPNSDIWEQPGPNSKEHSASSRDVADLTYGSSEMTPVFSFAEEKACCSVSL